MKVAWLTAASGGILAFASSNEGALLATLSIARTFARCPKVSTRSRRLGDDGGWNILKH